jgi:hypothetical protein
MSVFAPGLRKAQMTETKRGDNRGVLPYDILYTTVRTRTEVERLQGCLHDVCKLCAINDKGSSGCQCESNRSNERRSKYASVNRYIQVPKVMC